MTQDVLTVSLEPHLVERLRDVVADLPDELREEVLLYLPPPANSAVSSPSPSPVARSIPYPVLLKVSQWTRTLLGKEKLKAKSLDFRDYEMISLLAGSRTAPEKHFPVPAGGWPTPSELRERDAKREISDRQAIAHLVNALVSIGGATVAVWYAASVAGWTREWGVILALVAGLVVAIAEAGVYIIYTNYTSSPEQVKKRRLRADKLLEAETSEDKRSEDAELEAPSSNNLVEDASTAMTTATATAGARARQRGAAKEQQ